MDLISSLPDNVIHNILGRLSLREAVRTSILSKAWRYKWTSIPILVFNFQTDPFLRNENVVYEILRQHRGPLNKIFFNCIERQEIIDQWIPLINSSPIQDFTLRIFLGDRYVLRPHFFTFENLKHLCLYKCKFNPPQEFGGFSNLATLDFEYVEYVPSIVEKLISQSPLLESLRLVGCSKLDTFEIQGPSLRSFRFSGVFDTVSFKNSPVLAEVSLFTPILQNLGLQSSPGLTHFQVLPTVEKLHLQASILEFLKAGNDLPYSFDSLKCLDLSLFLSSIDEVASVLCLARSCPNLHTLGVTVHTTLSQRDAIKFIQAQEKPDRGLSQLRRVELKLFSFKAEIVVLSYLLACAEGLQEMVITPDSFSPSDEERILNQLKELPRASRNVLVSVIIRGEEHLVLQRSAFRRR